MGTRGLACRSEHWNREGDFLGRVSQFFWLFGLMGPVKKGQKEGKEKIRAQNSGTDICMCNPSAADKAAIRRALVLKRSAVWRPEKD